MGVNPSQKQLGNFMNDKELPKGLCPVGKIFWRVEEQDPDPSEGLKLVSEKMKRKELKEKEDNHGLVSQVTESNG